MLFKVLKIGEKILTYVGLQASVYEYLDIERKVAPLLCKIK